MTNPIINYLHTTTKQIFPKHNYKITITTHENKHPIYKINTTIYLITITYTGKGNKTTQFTNALYTDNIPWHKIKQNAINIPIQTHNLETHQQLINTIITTINQNIQILHDRIQLPLTPEQQQNAQQQLTNYHNALKKSHLKKQDTHPQPKNLESLKCERKLCV